MKRKQLPDTDTELTTHCNQMTGSNLSFHQAITHFKRDSTENLWGGKNLKMNGFFI